jgi:hypothetical protein
MMGLKIFMSRHSPAALLLGIAFPPGSTAGIIG